MIMDKSERFEKAAFGIFVLASAALLVWLIVIGTASFRSDAQRKDERTALMRRAVIVLERLEAREAAKADD